MLFDLSLVFFYVVFLLYDVYAQQAKVNKHSRRLR